MSGFVGLSVRAEGDRGQQGGKGRDSGEIRYEQTQRVIFRDRGGGFEWLGWFCNNGTFFYLIAALVEAERACCGAL